MWDCAHVSGQGEGRRVQRMLGLNVLTTTLWAPIWPTFYYQQKNRFARPSVSFLFTLHAEASKPDV